MGDTAAGASARCGARREPLPLQRSERLRSTGAGGDGPVLLLAAGTVSSDSPVAHDRRHEHGERGGKWQTIRRPRHRDADSILRSGRER